MAESSGYIIFIVVLIGLGMVMYLTSQSRQRTTLAAKSSDRLIALATGAPVIYLLPVLQILRERQAPTDWALPLLMRLAASTDPTRAIVGWDGLREHFAPQLPDLHLTNPTPTPSDRLTIREWLEKHPTAPSP